MLEHTIREVKVFLFFFSRNAFIFPHVYLRSLLFVSSSEICLVVLYKFESV